MALFFQRDATLKVFPNDRDGVFTAGTDLAFQIPLLEGFSFSQSTNSSEITLSEMESTTGDSRRSATRRECHRGPRRCEALCTMRKSS